MRRGGGGAMFQRTRSVRGRLLQEHSSPEGALPPRASGVRALRLRDTLSLEVSSCSLGGWWSAGGRGGDAGGDIV